MTKNIFAKMRASAIDLALALFGAHRLLSDEKIRMLELSDIEMDHVKQVLRTIKKLPDWQFNWQREAHKDLAEGRLMTDIVKAKNLYKRAAAKFYIAAVPLKPVDPERERIEHNMRAAYLDYGKLEGDRFEKLELTLCGFNVHGYFQHPRNSPMPPVAIVHPFLGGTKESMTFFSDFLLEAGFAVLRIDLPGVGESYGSMPPDSETICSAAIDYLFSRDDVDTAKIVSLGISLGAYWTMRTAAIDKRIALAVGISTPAMTSEQWDKHSKWAWLWWQKIYGTKDLRSTREVAEKMTLWNVFEKIECPVLLFHGAKDDMSHPKTIELICGDSRKMPDVKIYKRSGHGCIDMLKADVMPHTLKWCLDKLRQVQKA